MFDPDRFPDYDQEAKVESEKRIKIFKESGLKILPGWDSKAPEVFVHFVHGTAYEILESYNTRLLDHLYRIKHDSNVTYITEPYQLEEDEILLIAEVIKSGWQVDIHSQIALHYPGRTIAVRFFKERK